MKFATTTGEPRSSTVSGVIVMAFKRELPATITIYKIKYGKKTWWKMQMKDTAGNLRSESKSWDLAYLEKKAAEWWPGLPIQIDDCPIRDRS
jgi:hypothetical protein